MILLLGATGYIGQAFDRELVRRGEPFRALSRREVDYTRFDALVTFLRSLKPSLVINAAGFTGKPNVDACESQKAETLAGNTVLPLTVAQGPARRRGSRGGTCRPDASTRVRRWRGREAYGSSPT